MVPYRVVQSALIQMRTYYLVCFAFAAVSLPAWAQPKASSHDEVTLGHVAALAVHRLQSWYDPATGLYKTTGWWNSANAVTTLANYSRATSDKQYDDAFSNVLTAAQHTSKGFLNDYYDDEGWWALAWIDAYDLTHEQEYLEMAASIFADMAGGWDDSCSGGIWWSKERKYKNAIANELFLSVAAHLATRFEGKEQKARYLDWARREWQWFSRTGMINASHQVNDGLDANCRNNQQTTWTYNQGVILGGLAELYAATHDEALLVEANAIAAATIASPVLTDAQGILHEPCEPKCGADGTQFKGIFIRNLAEFDRIAPSAIYREFVLRNAESVWAGMHPPDYDIGSTWAPPYGKANASTESSGLDALVAAIELTAR
jgi:predicted alpha-1,6-mannanase (GH76 family)